MHLDALIHINGIFLASAPPRLGRWRQLDLRNANREVARNGELL